MDSTGRRLTWRRLALVGALSLSMGTNAACAVDFLPSLDAAREQNEAAQDQTAAARPVVVTFSAAWCGWCRKMTATTFPDPLVAAIAGDYWWVRLDAEAEPELAARYRVHGLPHTVLLDAEGRLLGAHPGYLSADALVKFLATAREHPQSESGPPADILNRWQAAESADARAAVVQEAVEHLARAESADRAPVLHSLRAAGTALLPDLVGLLDDERLSVRAASAGVLRQVTTAGPPFDPFADRATRIAQRDAWRGWIEALPAATREDASRD